MLFLKKHLWFNQKIHPHPLPRKIYTPEKENSTWKVENPLPCKSSSISRTSSSLTITPFEFLEHARKTKFQLLKIEYLQTHPAQFNRFINAVHGGNHVSSSPNSKGLFPTPSTPPSQNMLALSSSKTNKVEPFYMSLLIKGFQLNNCIIDSRASNNVISAKVENSLGLTLTRVNGTCYSMESK